MQKINYVRQQIIKLKMSQISEIPYFAVLLKQALSPEFCSELINMNHEWNQAKIYDGKKYIVSSESRNCQRSMFISEEITAKIMNIIKDHIPAEFSVFKFVGINPMLRFMKYGPGNYFKPHYDLTYTNEQGHKSMITVQIYLNDDYTGGTTDFYESERLIYSHIPKRGDILLFDQQVEHSGQTVESGEKYSVRTELMYSE